MRLLLNVELREMEGAWPTVTNLIGEDDNHIIQFGILGAYSRHDRIDLVSGLAIGQEKYEFVWKQQQQQVFEVC